MKRKTTISNLVMASAVVASILLTLSHSPRIEPRDVDNGSEQSYTHNIESGEYGANTAEIEPVSDQNIIAQSDISEAEVPNAAIPARYEITVEERAAIERMVASEGGYCPYEFQALVAQCILNGCEAEDIRPLELFERGDFWLTHDVVPTNDTKQAVSDVFDLGVMPTDEPIRYYYNPTYCSNPAHETFCYVLTNCGCRFFKDWE